MSTRTSHSLLKEAGGRVPKEREERVHKENHEITEEFGLRGTLKTIQFQFTYSEILII